MFIRHILAIAMMISLVAANSARGDNRRVYAPGEKIDPNDVAMILHPPVMRSIRPALKPNESGDSNADRIAVRIPFDFGSATLSGQSYEQLDALAQGIKQAGPDVKVLIEGHTDAKGSDRYNVVLSYKRANAVKSYFVRNHQLHAANLKTIGMGKSTPINPQDPFAAENRRVEFRAFQ